MMSGGGWWANVSADLVAIIFVTISIQYNNRLTCGIADQ